MCQLRAKDATALLTTWPLFYDTLKDFKAQRDQAESIASASSTVQSLPLPSSPLPSNSQIRVNKQITDPKETKGNVMPERQKIANSGVCRKACEPQRRPPLWVDPDGEMYVKCSVAARDRTCKTAEDL